jgi:hypothetical protein
MIPYQHPSFVEGWSQEHRQRLISEAETYRRMRSVRRKRGAFDATCFTLGTWLLTWGTWLVNRYRIVGSEPFSVSTGSSVQYKTPSTV